MDPSVTTSIEKYLEQGHRLTEDGFKRIKQHLTSRQPLALHGSVRSTAKHTFGQRAADAVANFGGSWTFIFIFTSVLITWILMNSWLLHHYKTAFDPYPYILLNLVLSMLAAIQAPIIMMSQNRQNQKDREQAMQDYEINLKAELEILGLHEKIDHLREKQWADLLQTQQQQLDLLSKILEHERKN